MQVLKSFGCTWLQVVMVRQLKFGSWAAWLRHRQFVGQPLALVDKTETADGLVYTGSATIGGYRDDFSDE